MQSTPESEHLTLIDNPTGAPCEDRTASLKRFREVIDLACECLSSDELDAISKLMSWAIQGSASHFPGKLEAAREATERRRGIRAIEGNRPKGA